MSTLALTTGLLMVAMLALYRTRYSSHPSDVWSGPAAWLRAGIYFCFCLLVSMATGALQAALQNPLVEQAQLSNPWWWAFTLLISVFILAAYWGYWYRSTLRFNRPLALIPQGVFGLCWGVTTGLYFLSFWHLVAAIGPEWPLWGTWLLAYGLISAWQALWMDMYWDVWVSPEHDTPESIKAKVPRTHIPNMTLCLTHFALFENYWIFIGWQTTALLAASYGMRLQPPWSNEPTPPARQVPGLFGLPRAGGYVATDTKEG